MPTASSTPPLLDIAATRHRPVVALLEERLGRPIRGRLLSTDNIARVKPSGLDKLHTIGPLTHRYVVLEDSLPPHLPVAVAWALMVEARLPISVRVALVGTGEPLDRLLSSHNLPWTADLTEDVITSPASTAATHFTWVAPGTSLVQATRILHVDDQPVAITIEEVPLPARGTDTLSPTWATSTYPTISVPFRPPSEAAAGRYSDCRVKASSTMPSSVVTRRPQPPSAAYRSFGRV